MKTVNWRKIKLTLEIAHKSYRKIVPTTNISNMTAENVIELFLLLQKFTIILRTYFRFNEIPHEN